MTPPSDGYLIDVAEEIVDLTGHFWMPIGGHSAAPKHTPVLIGKYQRRLPDFDDKVISMYARGMSTREIQGHLEEIYGAEVSPQLISTVTDAVSAGVAEWQSRPLKPLYPVMFFDAIRVKVRDQGTVSNKAAYLALGLTPDGRKHALGLWIDPNEGAKF